MPQAGEQIPLLLEGAGRMLSLLCQVPRTVCALRQVQLGRGYSTFRVIVHTCLCLSRFPMQCLVLCTSRRWLSLLGSARQMLSPRLSGTRGAGVPAQGWRGSSVLRGGFQQGARAAWPCCSVMAAHASVPRHSALTSNLTAPLLLCAGRRKVTFHAIASPAFRKSFA